MPGHDDDLALLMAAAREVGPIAMRFWKRDPKSWDKGGTLGPVTEADLAVNDRLRGVLTGARPDYGWLSEETPDDPARLADQRCFIVDPIDGTRAFIDGQDGFAHALAVTDGPSVTAAVVYLPARDLMYTATAGSPALLNGVAIAPTEPAAGLDGASVLTSGAALKPDLWRDGIVPPLRRAFRPSLAWRFCLVAEGRFDAALSIRPTWEWDIAAASLIAERAGCVVTDAQGGVLEFNSPAAQTPGAVVAAPKLHQKLIAALSPKRGAAA